MTTLLTSLAVAAGNPALVLTLMVVVGILAVAVGTYYYWLVYQDGEHAATDTSEEEK